MSRLSHADVIIIDCLTLPKAIFYTNSNIVFFRVTRPLVIGKLVAYFDTNSKMTINDAYFYASLVIGITILQTIYNHGYMLYLQQMAQKIRIGLCSLIYRKSLKLSTSAMVDVSSGKIVTLITKDVLLFDSAVVLAHDIWIGVIQVVLMTYVMYIQIGVSAIFGVGFLILLIPFQSTFRRTIILIV